MSFMFGCFVLFLGLQLESIQSAPCDCELMTKCELQKAYEELECLANSFTCSKIKDKVLEFLNLFKAVPIEKITRKRFCAASQLVKIVFATLKDKCLTVEEKLDGVNALMAILGLVPSPCTNAKIDSSIWDEWIQGISCYLKDYEPVRAVPAPQIECA